MNTLELVRVGDSVYEVWTQETKDRISRGEKFEVELKDHKTGEWKLVWFGV